MKQAFKDGQTFYLLAPGCDKKIAENMAKFDLKMAFSSKEEISEKFKHAFRTEKTIAYYKEFKRGVLDKLEKYPDLIPKKWQKLLAKLMANGKLPA